VSRTFTIGIVPVCFLAGCAGCLGLGDAPDDDARPSNGGQYDPHVIDDDASGAVDGHEAGGSSPDVRSEDTTTQTDSHDSSFETGDSESEMGAVAVCGNGVIEPGEACDDSNTDPGDYCALDCGAETGRCGDGILQSNESCDDGAIATGCDSLRDGGDGACVAAGTCSVGYISAGVDCVPEVATYHVHIHVANDCSMMVDPVEMTVPKGQKARFEWHNHSRDYPVTVWQSYIGGYTDLPPGQTWFEIFEWCANVNPYTGYSDISTVEVCPEHRFYIHCQGQ